MFTPDGAVYYQAEYNADGSHIIYQDINRDEMTDIQEMLSIDPFGEERLYDRDFDGHPEERVRIEFDESNNSVTVIYERDDEGPWTLCYNFRELHSFQFRGCRFD